MKRSISGSFADKLRIRTTAALYTLPTRQTICRRCLHLRYCRCASIYLVRSPTYAANKAVMVNTAGVANVCSDTSLIQSVIEIPPALWFGSWTCPPSRTWRSWKLCLGSTSGRASGASVEGAVSSGISANSTRYVATITGRAQLSSTTRPPVQTRAALERASSRSIFPPARPIKLLPSP